MRTKKIVSSKELENLWELIMEFKSIPGCNYKKIVSVFRNYTKTEIKNLLYLYNLKDIDIYKIYFLVNSRSNFFSSQIFKMSDEIEKYALIKELLDPSIIRISAKSWKFAFFLLSKQDVDYTTLKVFSISMSKISDAEILELEKALGNTIV